MRDLACPYCGRPLRWIPLRWFNRGCYQCDRCGDFPDLYHRPAAPPIPGEAHDPTATFGNVYGERPRVLLVDDAQEQRDLYALMLEEWTTVVTASRGEDALVVAAQTPLDAIILDVLMPGMSGWDVCARLKENPATRDIPVIILTSIDGEDAVEPAERAGAAAVLMKPCPLERLTRTVEAVIRSSGARRDPQTGRHRKSPLVLIVDPHEPTVARLRSQLTAAGYTTAAANSFVEGMRLLRALHPDALIAALRLAEFNGLQFVAASERHLPTIIIGTEPFEEKESRALGAEYVERPVDPDAVIALLRRLAPIAKPAAPSRRWTRKRVTTSVPAIVGRSPALLRDVSYGGMCLAIAAADAAIPASVDITFPDARQTVRARVVWRDQTEAGTWLYGAQVPVVTDAWQNLVDAIS